jgi:hypothetical protein
MSLERSSDLSSVTDGLIAGGFHLRIWFIVNESHLKRKIIRSSLQKLVRMLRFKIRLNLNEKLALKWANRYMEKSENIIYVTLRYVDVSFRFNQIDYHIVFWISFYYFMFDK